MNTETAIAPYILNRSPLELWVPGGFPIVNFFLITPQRAARLLELNTANVRPGNPRWWRSYSKTMKEHGWYLTSEGILICFNAATGELTLGDGQNRLMAIVDSGMAQPMVVVVGLPIESQIGMNIGHKRSQDVALRASGFVTSRQETEIARAMILLPCGRDGDVSSVALRAFIGRHREAIAFAADACKSKKKLVSQKPILAILARAFYAFDNYVKQYKVEPKYFDRLREFADRLATGVCYGDEDSSVIRLRNWLLEKEHEHVGGTSWREELARRTQFHLREFLQKRKGTCTKRLDTNAFPLPEELPAIKS